MFNFKQLDFFRKTDQTRSTVIGGLVSLLSLVVSFCYIQCYKKVFDNILMFMFIDCDIFSNDELQCITLLVLTRVTEFLTPVVKKDLFVTSNMEVDPMINMHMDVVFPNAPCGSKYTNSQS